MAITNQTHAHGPLPIAIKLDGTTLVTVDLNPECQYDLEHTGLQEDMSTAAAVNAFFTTEQQGNTPATVTAAQTGAQGRGWLKSGTTKRIGPGLNSISLLAASAANPVVQVTPLGRG